MRQNPGMAGTRLAIDLTDEPTTCRFAEDIAAVLQPGDLIAISGDLGSGKTAIARAMIRSASGEPDLDVPSPTFSIRIDYELTRLTIVHVDLYRVNSEEEAQELGLEDALIDGAVIVEWPERVNLPDGANRIDLTIRQTGETRQAELTVQGSWPQRLARSHKIRAFLDTSGYCGAQRLHVVGDASAKSFERIVLDDTEPVILMNSPARTEGPAFWNGRSYDAVAHRAMDILPFLAIGSELHRAGFPVPRIRAADRTSGLALMDDLGEETIAGRSGQFIAERYETAIDLLSQMHEREWPADIAYGSETYALPHYDRDALLIEISLYADWYLAGSGDTALTDDERQAFLDAWSNVLSALGAHAECWVMRDFHSPNILWRAEADGSAGPGIIDIQDTLIGHPAYDVASLAQDVRVDISDEEEAALVERYCTSRRTWDPGFEEDIFRRDYTVLAAQRATKVLGAFTRLSAKDGKTGYEAHIPRVRKILARNLSHPVLSDLRVWYHGMI